MSKEPIKIAIVEDHNLVRESLASLLDQVPEFEVIYHVPTSEELMSRLTWKEQPDVFLVDYNLKKCFGDQCVRAIREKLGDFYDKTKTGSYFFFWFTTAHIRCAILFLTAFKTAILLLPSLTFRS